MDQAALLAKIAAGNGQVAQYLGSSCSQYRASGTSAVITVGNLIGSLPAYLVPSEKLQEHPEWIGMFDTTATLQGDYLVVPEGTIYFIAAQVPFTPLLCIQTNATVGLSRPIGVSAIDGGGYSGVSATTSEVLLAGWPASLAASGKAKQGETPNDDGLSAWVVLMPPLPLVPLVGDIVGDDIGRSFVVTAAERTSLGWQLHTKQASS